MPNIIQAAQSAGLYIESSTCGKNHTLELTRRDGTKTTITCLSWVWSFDYQSSGWEVTYRVDHHGYTRLIPNVRSIRSI